MRRLPAAVPNEHRSAHAPASYLSRHQPLYIYAFGGIETYRTRMVGLLATISTARFDLRDGKIVDSRTAR